MCIYGFIILSVCACDGTPQFPGLLSFQALTSLQRAGLASLQVLRMRQQRWQEPEMPERANSRRHRCGLEVLLKIQNMNVISKLPCLLLLGRPANLLLSLFLLPASLFSCHHIVFVNAIVLILPAYTLVFIYFFEVSTIKSCMKMFKTLWQYIGS